MGLYNTYGKNHIQLKVGNLELTHYKVGDKVDIEDGCYISYDGLIIIKKHKLLATFSEGKLWDKYGSRLDVEEILNKNNPIYPGTAEIIVKRREKEEQFRKLERVIKEDLEIAPIDIEGSRKEFNKLHKEVTEKLEKKENE